jgi:hypothetical protein
MSSEEIKAMRDINQVQHVQRLKNIADELCDAENIDPQKMAKGIAEVIRSHAMLIEEGVAFKSDIPSQPCEDCLELKAQHLTLAERAEPVIADWAKRLGYKKITTESFYAGIGRQVAALIVTVVISVSCSIGTAFIIIKNLK